MEVEGHYQYSVKLLDKLTLDSKHPYLSFFNQAIMLFIIYIKLQLCDRSEGQRKRVDLETHGAISLAPDV